MKGIRMVAWVRMCERECDEVVHGGREGRKLSLTEKAREVECENGNMVLECVGVFAEGMYCRSCGWI